MKNLITFILLLITFSSFAQMEKADKLYEDYKYSQAILLYKPLADSGNIKAVRKIADSYRKINEYENAEKYYAIVVADKNAVPKSFLYYGQALMNNGKYEEAKVWLNKYIATKPEDNTLAKNLLVSCDKAKENTETDRKIIFKNLSWLNSSA